MLASLCKSLQVFAAFCIPPAPSQLMFVRFVDHSCCFRFRVACLLWRDFWIVLVRIQVLSWGLLNLLNSFPSQVFSSSHCLVHLGAIRCAGARALLWVWLCPYGDVNTCVVVALQPETSVEDKTGHQLGGLTAWSVQQLCKGVGPRWSSEMHKPSTVSSLGGRPNRTRCGFGSRVFQSLVASQICPGWGTREGRGPLRLKYFLHEETLPPLSYTSYLHLLLSLALPMVFLWVGQRCSALAFVLLCADLNCMQSLQICQLDPKLEEFHLSYAMYARDSAALYVRLRVCAILPILSMKVFNDGWKRSDSIDFTFQPVRYWESHRLVSPWSPDSVFRPFHGWSSLKISAFCGKHLRYCQMISTIQYGNMVERWWIGCFQHVL